MSGALHLLLVDDNEVNLDLLGRRLVRKGCTVVTATSGAEALRTLESERFDAVLLDLRMPGMTGLEVLQAIRRTQSQIELPVIMATAQTDPADMVATLEAGANDYVTKPIDVDVLYARVRAHVRARSVVPVEPVATRRSSTAPSLSIGPGTTIDGRYRLEELLGTGGFGSVYRARHLKLDSDIAIKILHPHLVGAASIRKRFELEAISTCRVRHPHAVQVLDAGTSDGGLPYLAMELLTGPSLAEELGSVFRFSLRRSAEILLPIIDVLAEAHRVGIIHRDVKPANVILADSARGEVVKVLDFGIAMFLDRDKQVGLTGDGTVGTPLYMAPEALLGRPVTTASDVFSLGVTAYVMLAGDPPHGPPAENAFEQAIRQVHHRPVALGRHRPDLPTEIQQLIMATLASEPSHRPTLMELRETIERCAASFEEPEWPLPSPSGKPITSSGPPSADDTTMRFSGDAVSPRSPREESGVEARQSPEATGESPSLPSTTGRKAR